MSDNSHPSAHEHHTGPISTPKQFLWTGILSFVVPVFIIIGLVYYVTSSAKPAGSENVSTMTLAGVTKESSELEVTRRIQKVGAVEIRDVNRTMKSGEEVYKAQCVTCHGTGAAGSPKFGDAGAWGARISKGFDTLLPSALKGKNAMPAQSGGDFDDFEIARAVVYMANAGGAKFAEPVKAAGPAGAASGAAAPAAVAAAPAPQK